MALIENLKFKQIAFLIKSLPLKKTEIKTIVIYKKKRNFIIKRLKKDIRPYQVYKLVSALNYEGRLLLLANLTTPASDNFKKFLISYSKLDIYIRGKDLKELGINSGPVFSRIFERVLQAKIEGRIKTYAEEKAFLKKILPYYVRRYT
jgi:hypothetical protein